MTKKERKKLKKYYRDLQEKTILQQKAKCRTYIALAFRGLPIPKDLDDEIGALFNAR